MHSNCNKGGWISAKCSVGEDGKPGAGIPGQPLVPSSQLQPQAGEEALRDLMGQCLLGVLPQSGERMQGRGQR